MIARVAPIQIQKHVSEGNSHQKDYEPQQAAQLYF
jgi:hypothetical protein